MVSTIKIDGSNPFLRDFWYDESRCMKNYVEYHRQKEFARGFVHSRLEVFNEHYCFVYNRVAIRNQRTRWGSCSKKGNLNFNYRIASLPIHLADYVIVHELCHLGEFNHSQKFWSLVARAIPDHRARRRELRAIRIGVNF